MVSERTPPGTKSRVKALIEPPKAPILEFREEHISPEYEYEAESLNAKDFKEIVKKARFRSSYGPRMVPRLPSS